MWCESFFSDLTNEGYGFHYSKNDNQDLDIGLDYRFPNISNVNDFKKIVKSELDKNINKHAIQIVVPVAKMGESIYLGLVGFFPIYKIEKIDTYSIDEQSIENKNVLIFDDNIKTGKTIRSQIETILRFKPKKIIVFSLVTRSDTYFKLIREYLNNKKIIFYNVLVIPKEVFTDVWRVLIWPFIEYHGLPLLETPYVAGEVNSIENLKDLYRKIVLNKKKAASIINPAVVDESLVVKGSVNYTKFFKNKYTNINHSKLFLRFFFLRLTPSKFNFVLYPEFGFSDISINCDLCSNGPLFSFCFKNKYNDIKVCPDCVLYNLCNDINESVFSVCKNSFENTKLIKDNTEFIDRYYPRLLKILE